MFQNLDLKRVSRLARRRTRAGVEVVLRLRRSPGLPRARALIAIVTITISQAIAQAGAQEAGDTGRFLLRPLADRDPDNPPRLRDGRAFGAGTTGFVSTHARRRKGKNPPKASSAGTKNADAAAQLSASSAVPLVSTTSSAGPGRQDQVRRAIASSATYTTAVSNGTMLIAPLSPPLHRRLLPEDDPSAPIGAQVGVFTLRPALELTGAHDTNPARSPAGTPSWYGVVAPELLINSNWARHEVAATLRGSYLSYERTAELDRPNFDGRVNGRVDVTGTTRLDLETHFLVGTDNPGSPNIQAGLARLPIFTTLGGTAGITQRFNRLDITAKGSVDRTFYQESHFTDGSAANNDARDYIRYSAALRAAYELIPGTKPFVEVAGDNRTHDLAGDALGVNRDSEGLSVKAGTTFEYSQKLTGELSVGYLTRHYRDIALQSFGGLLLDGALIWTASALTTVKLVTATSVGESIIPGVSGVFTRELSAQIDHAFRRWLIATAKFSVGVDDYEGSSRLDKRYAASALLTYRATREAWLKAEYRHEWRSSSVAGNDFAADIVLFGVRLQR